MSSCDLAKRVSLRMGGSKPAPGRKHCMQCKPSSGHPQTFPGRVESSQIAESATYASLHRTDRADRNRYSATNLSMAPLTLPGFRPSSRLKNPENNDNVLHRSSTGDHDVFAVPLTFNFLIGQISRPYTSTCCNRAENDHLSYRIHARLALSETVP